MKHTITKKLFFVVLLIIGLLQSVASKAQLKVLSINQLEYAMKDKPKPVVVYLHTSWCSYCSLMERKVWKNNDVINRLNNDFYFVRLSAEEQEAIIFQGKQYSFKKNGIKGGTHELVYVFSSKNSYPTIVFLNQTLEKLYEYNGYLKVEHLLLLLNNLY